MVSMCSGCVRPKQNLAALLCSSLSAGGIPCKQGTALQHPSSLLLDSHLFPHGFLNALIDHHIPQGLTGWPVCRDWGCKRPMRTKWDLTACCSRNKV